MNLKRIRIGSVVIGMKVVNENHALMTRFMIGHVADTMGILNRFVNTDKQCIFIDYDDYPLHDIQIELNNLMFKYNIKSFFLFESDDSGHRFGISPDLVDKQVVRSFLLDSHCDDKFVYIYCKNGDNTIRIAPKFADRPYRQQGFIMTITNLNYNGSPLYHTGLLVTLISGFSDIDISQIDKIKEQDNSSVFDVIWKVYETIRW